MPPGGEAQNSRRRTAEDRIEVLQEQYTTLARRAREAASEAAADIRGAIDDGVKDNWWERNTSWLSKARDYLGWAAAAVGIALAIALAVVTAPAWLVVGLIVLGVVLAGAALYISVNLARKADGSWGDVAWDVVSLLSFGVGGVATRVASKAFPTLQSAVAGIRASRAQRAVVDAVPPHLLTELRRTVTVAVDPGDALAARQLLAEVTTRGRDAARVARDGTFAPFQITVVQHVVDGGKATSQVARQAREMLLDLRTMPGSPVDPAVLREATRVVRTSTAGIVAVNTGAVAEVGQALTDPPTWRDSGPVKILTDIVQRVT